MYKLCVHIILVSLLLVAVVAHVAWGKDDAGPKGTQVAEQQSVVDEIPKTMEPSRGSRTLAYSIFLILGGIAVFIIFKGTRRW